MLIRERLRIGKKHIFKSQLLDAVSYSGCLAAHGGAGQKSHNNELLAGATTPALAPVNSAGLNAFNTDRISLFVFP